MDIKKIAHKYRDHGFSPIPLVRNSKRPLLKGWQQHAETPIEDFSVVFLDVCRRLHLNRHKTISAKCYHVNFRLMDKRKGDVPIPLNQFRRTSQFRQRAVFMVVVNHLIFDK